MRILITGVHGFVGRAISACLAPEHTIYGVDIVSPESPNVARTYSWQDLDADLASETERIIPEVDAIIHLAAMVHDVKDAANEEVYYTVNTGLTKKIYDWYLKFGAGRFIFFSTVKAAADSVEGVLTEDVVPHPVGAYGCSKLQAEAYILSHLPESAMPFEAPATEDKRFVYILRPCMIHGSGNKGNLPLLYNIVRKGIPWPLGEYDNLRTFTSIENLLFVVKGLLDKDISSGIYNMGDDEPLSTNELVQMMCASLGRRAHIWHLPKWLISAVAGLGGVLHLPLNHERLRKLTENYISSNAKIKAALGVDRMPVSAREGMMHTFEAFRGDRGR